MSARDQAVSLLTHYLRYGWEAAGLTWEQDNTSEVEQLVDAIDAMISEGLQTHIEGDPHIYPDGSTS